jgi:hypothetical protein
MPPHLYSLLVVLFSLVFLSPGGRKYEMRGPPKDPEILSK